MTAGGGWGADRPEWPREPADRSQYGQGQRYPTDPLQSPQEHPSGYPEQSQGPRTTYPPPDAYPAAPPAPYGPAYGAPMWHPPRPLASWGQRAGAYVIDSLIVMLVALVPGLILLIPPIVSASSQDGEPSGAMVLLMVLGFLVIFLVAVVGQLWYLGSRQGELGTTVGKRMLGIRLVDMYTGQPIGKGRGLGRSAIRWALGTVSVSIISLLWPLWDAKRQTWEDMLVKSIVVIDDPHR